MDDIHAAKNLKLKFVVEPEILKNPHSFPGHAGGPPGRLRLQVIYFSPFIIYKTTLYANFSESPAPEKHFPVKIKALSPSVQKL